MIFQTNVYLFNLTGNFLLNKFTSALTTMEESLKDLQAMRTFYPESEFDEDIDCP